MLRTCLDTAETSTKDFPTATATPATTTAPAHSGSYSDRVDKSAACIYDNGDIFASHNNKSSNHDVYRQATAFTDQFPIPEEIPGLPRHRPGEYSPTYDRRSAASRLG